LPILTQETNYFKVAIKGF